MLNFYDFKFGNCSLSDLGGKMQQSPELEIAQRDISFIDVPGKDGSDILDNGRYSNVEMNRSIAFLSGNGFSADEKVTLAIQKLMYLQGYQDFEDTDHCGLVTKAVLTNFEAVNKSLRTCKSANLVFSRQPFWYRKDGLEEQQIFTNIVSNAQLVNPYLSTCKPIIRFYFSYPYTTFSTGSVEFYINTTVNGVYQEFTFDISNIEININYNICEMDFEKQRLIVRNNNGDIHEYIDIEIPKELGQGDIHFMLRSSTRLSKICIVPKWRTL